MKILLAIIILLFPTLGFSQSAGEGPIKFGPNAVYNWQNFNSQIVHGNMNSLVTVGNLAISEDGEFATYYYCAGSHCRFNPFDSIASCEEKSNKKCFIFANRVGNIVWKNPGDFLDNEAVELRKNEPIYGQGNIKFNQSTVDHWKKYYKVKDGNLPEKVFVISKDGRSGYFRFYDNKYNIPQLLVALERKFNTKLYVFAINDEIKWEDPGDFLP